MHITFIQTGGTIDKDYPRLTQGWGFEIGEPAVKRILAKLNPSFDFEIMSIFKKDSQEITDGDRTALVELIQGHANNKFVITHGTDTIIETATVLSQQIENRLIILSGSMRPQKFSDSDAEINIGAALGACSLLENGVYITLHGIIKKASEMQRDLTSGKFY